MDCESKSIWGKWSLRLAWTRDQSWLFFAAKKLPWLGMAILAAGKLSVVLTWPIDLI